MATEIEAAAVKLGKLIGLLSSPSDGEKLAAIAAIDRFLAAHGCDWTDIASAVPVAFVDLQAKSRPKELSLSPRAASLLAMAVEIERRGPLSPKEADFVRAMVDLLRAGDHASLRQEKWLRDIHARGNVRAAA